MTKNRSHTQRDSATKVRDITLNPTQLYIICRPLSNKIKQKEIEQELFQLELSLVNQKNDECAYARSTNSMSRYRPLSSTYNSSIGQ
jgi:hypothetical protein